MPRYINEYWTFEDTGGTASLNCGFVINGGRLHNSVIQQAIQNGSSETEDSIVFESSVERDWIK